MAARIAHLRSGPSALNAPAGAALAALVGVVHDTDALHRTRPGGVVKGRECRHRDHVEPREWLGAAGSTASGPANTGRARGRDPSRKVSDTALHAVTVLFWTASLAPPKTLNAPATPHPRTSGAAKPDTEKTCTFTLLIVTF